MQKFVNYKDELQYPYASNIINVIRDNSISGTGNYLLTLAQLSDYIKNDNFLWNKNLKLIFMTPFPEEYGMSGCSDFIITDSGGKTLSFINGLAELNDLCGYTGMIQNIIYSIHKTNPHQERPCKGF